MSQITCGNIPSQIGQHRIWSSIARYFGIIMGLLHSHLMIIRLLNVNMHYITVQNTWPKPIILVLLPAMICWDRFGDGLSIQTSTKGHRGRYVNTLRQRKNGRHFFADNILKCIFLNENVWISIKISLKFVLNCPISNIPALVQIMACSRPGDKPLPGPMMVSLLTHICVTQPQWVNCNVLGKDPQIIL